jgi:uncharacterized protein YfeS
MKSKYAKATLSYRKSDVVIETISHPHFKKVAKHSFYEKYRDFERHLRTSRGMPVSLNIRDISDAKQLLLRLQQAKTCEQ